MRVHHVPMIAASIAVLVVHPAAAQSKRGTWTGTSTTQQGTQQFTIVLDSSASGWKGAAVAPATTSDSLRLVDVSVRADTVEFGIPVNGMTVYISALAVGDKLSGQIWMQNTNVGSLQLTRKAGAAQNAPSPQTGQHSPTALRDSLKATLAFLASFDHGFDADYAHGDPLIYSAPSYSKLGEAVGGVVSPDVVIAKGQGRYGDALQFRKKNTGAVFYRAAVSSGYRPRNWSGTVSFWLSLGPDTDLEPGYTDPLQITDKEYNNAAIWVDFTRDDKPRHFRLGVFGDSAAWNKSNLSSDKDPFFNQRTVVVTQPPFAHGQWTHVAIAFSGLGTDAGGTAKLYLNGKLAGTADGIREPFTWEPFLATVRLGVNYTGLFDELSMYTRALNDAEVDALYHLDGGVGTLMR